MSATERSAGRPCTASTLPRLFRLVLEQAAPGTVAHAVADEGDTMRSIAEVIGSQLDLPAEAVPLRGLRIPRQASSASTSQSSSALTASRGSAGKPTHPSLLEDLEAGNYPT